VNHEIRKTEKIVNRECARLGEISDLGDGQHGDEVDPEVFSEVARGDLGGVGDELPAAEDAGRGGDERGAELEVHVHDVEEVGDGAEDGDGFLEPGRDADAGVGVVDVGEVVEERVHEHGHQARADEEGVPPLQLQARRVQVRLPAPRLRVALVVPWRRARAPQLAQPKNPRRPLLAELLTALVQRHVRLGTVPVRRIQVRAEPAPGIPNSFNESSTLTDITGI
jgi:hypothetical protein